MQIGTKGGNNHPLPETQWGKCQNNAFFGVFSNTLPFTTQKNGYAVINWSFWNHGDFHGPEILAYQWLLPFLYSATKPLWVLPSDQRAKQLGHVVYDLGIALPFFHLSFKLLLQVSYFIIKSLPGRLFPHASKEQIITNQSGFMVPQNVQAGSSSPSQKKTRHA